MLSVSSAILDGEIVIVDPQGRCNPQSEGKIKEKLNFANFQSNDWKIQVE